METIKIHRKEDYAILELARYKTNPINVTMMKEISQAITDLANDSSVKGVIINGQPGFFSVGLDVKELLSLDKESSKVFFSSFSRMVFDLVQFPKPMIAAITGHAPAGGCVIAICCDFRIMAEGEAFRIGLNEVPVGVMVPPHILELYGFWLGKGKAYQFLLEGKLHATDEALACGLIDKIVDLASVLPAAEQKMKELLAVDFDTLMGTKMNLRHPLIKKMITLAKDTPIGTEQHFWKESSQKRLRMLVAKISKN